MITASIVAYRTDRDEMLRAIGCLRSSGVARVYVIDNSASMPDNPVAAYAGDLGEGVVYIPSENVGYGAGHNRGIRLAMQAGADYHIVMNSDLYWSDPVVETLAAYMEADPDVGQMMPRVLNTDGSLQLQCKLVPTPADLLLKRYMPRWLKRRRMRRFQLEFSGYDHVMNVPYLSGCFMFFRVDALRDVGLFDERFFMYPEDIDITRRMHERWKTLYCPDVAITHIYAQESHTNPRLKRVHIVNMIRYFNKWGWLIDRSRRRFNKRLLRSERELGNKP